MKIEIKNTLLEAFKFYKKGFSKLIGYLVIMFIYSQLITACDYYAKLRGADDWLVNLFSLCTSLVMILYIIFIPKLVMAIEILLNELLSKRDMKLGEAYKKTEGKYWTYIGHTLAVGLLYVVPCTVLVMIEFPYASIIGQLFIMLILARYYMLVPLIAIEEKTSKYFSKATKLVKGHYFYVLILYFLTSTIFILPYAIITYMVKEASILLIVGTIYNIIQFFVTPLFIVTNIIVYKQLAAEVQEENDGTGE